MILPPEKVKKAKNVLGWYVQAIALANLTEATCMCKDKNICGVISYECLTNL